MKLIKTAQPSLFHPSERAASMERDLLTFTGQIQKLADSEDWSRLKLTEDAALRLWERVILKVLNCVIKIFNSRYSAIDRLFAVNSDFETLQRLQHKISKLNLHPLDGYKSPYIVTAQKIELGATQSRFDSLHSAVLRDRLSQMQQAQAANNSAAAAEKFHSLSDKLRTILNNIAAMHGNKSSQAKSKKEIEQMLTFLSQICDEQGNNVFTQIEQMLEKKRKLCWDLSVLKLTEHRLHQGASLEDVQGDFSLCKRSTSHCC